MVVTGIICPIRIISDLYSESCLDNCIVGVLPPTVIFANASDLFFPAISSNSEEVLIVNVLSLFSCLTLTVN